MKIIRGKASAGFISTLMILLAVYVPAVSQSTGQSTQLSTVSMSAPKYGPIALAAKAKGMVVIRVRVDQEGNVIFAEAVEGPPLLRRPAEDAARLWKFNPSSSAASRLVNLEFAFDFRFHESTETKDEAVYVPPYRIELTRKIATIAPLSRISGQPPEERCPLHNEVMKLDIVSIFYGLPSSVFVRNSDDIVSFFRNVWGRFTHRATYEEVRYKKFPYSNMSVGGGCNVGYERNAEVLYCPKCRAIEVRWRKKHPNQGPRAVTAISGS